MKKFILIILLIIGWGNIMFAQEKDFEVTGVVTDQNKEPLIGVSVVIKDNPGLGTITDIDGRYKIKIPPYSRLIFRYIGFENQEILVKEERVVDVVLEASKTNVLTEVTVTGTGAQEKVTITGAVTTVDVKDLKTPTASISNALAGNIPGIMARQTSGQPGDNVSEFWIRGISTFGAGSSALVLVDGFERDLNELNIEDIETFSVLKDASATAIYGSRGANGVVLITTKRGKSGKVQINAKVESTYSMRTYTPELVDGYTYAQLMNEARTTRNQTPYYSTDDLRLIKYGLDPDLFPNIDWMNMFLKDGASTFRATLNLNGGGSNARYYISGSYVDEGGIYNTEEALKEYKTNSNYKRWNYRMNVDMDITPSTLIKVGVSGSLGKQNQPGGLYDEIWGALLGQNQISIPTKYSNGYIASRGEGQKQSPWVLITQQGYAETWNNKIQSTLTLEQKLDFVTKGLKFNFRFGFDTNNENYIRRIQTPEGWEAERLRNSDGDLVFKRTVKEQIMKQSSTSEGERKENMETELQYNRNFDNHRLVGVIKYTQDKIVNTSNIGDDIIQGIERRHQVLAGRFTYGWKLRYFLDFNFGYSGSENFAKGHQYGFFPAYSGAWNIAEEPIIKDKVKFLEMLKLRYSYGKVGNDYMKTRFPYLSTFQTVEKYGYSFGDIENNIYSYNGLTYSTLAAQNVTWEIATKHDLGLDFSMWNSKINGAIDYFQEQRDGIYTTRSYIAPSIGIGQSSAPSANVGSVESKGFDGNIALNHKFGDVDFTLRSNVTYSKNKILEYDEEYSHFGYTQQEGYRVDQARGLIALGLFKDFDEIRDSPKQTYGTVMPGDIKYKDVNGDGVIDKNDIVPIGATTKPNLVYGFGASLQWNGFDFNVHFQGAGKSSFFINGYTVYPFSQGDWGNVLTDVVGNYWSLGVNEDPEAKYPRLSYGGNSNNYQASSYWLRDGSYLRLKTLEVGYSIPKKYTTKIYLENVRFFFMGTNLMTFSNFKLWDPELGSSTGQAYPLSKSLTIGLIVNL